MFELIHWKSYLRVKKQAGAERVINRMGRVMGDPFTLLSYERYWKIPELAEVRLISPLGAREPQDAVFRTLLAVQRLGGPWSVGCRVEDDRVEFDGIAAKTAHAGFVVPGVEWLWFSVADD